MSAIYYLKHDESNISFEVQVGTTGNAATVPTIRRTGGTVVDLQSSTNASGNIPESSVGVSADLINSALVVTTMILFGENDDLDQAFSNLSMTVIIHGGLDGNQSYDIADSEKSEFTNHRSIVATKAIKLQSQ